MRGASGRRPQAVTPTPQDSGRRSRRAAIASMILGLLTAGVVLAAGLWFASEQPTEWTADSHHLMAPSLQERQSVTSSLYDTLSGGELPSTAAAILAEEQLLTETQDELGFSDSGSASTQVSVVPETTVIRVEVTAGDAATAEAIADALPQRGAAAVERLLPPFELVSLGSAEGSAELSSLSSPQWVSIVIVVALVAGVAVQQAVHHTARALFRR